MNSSIVVALITAGATVLAVVITSIASSINLNAKLDKQQAVFEAVVNERMNALKQDMGRLEHKQDKHNQLMERTFKLEEKTALHEAELKRMDERIDRLDGGEE